MRACVTVCACMCVRKEVIRVFFIILVLLDEFNKIKVTKNLQTWSRIETRLLAPLTITLTSFLYFVCLLSQAVLFVYLLFVSICRLCTRTTTTTGMGLSRTPSSRRSPETFPSSTPSACSTPISESHSLRLRACSH